MLATLGLFVFELPTLPYAQLQRRRDWRHEEAKRIGARDALQFTGPGADTISLDGAIAPGEIGNHTAIDTLEEMADTGETYSFVDGTGRVWGEFVIVAIDLRQKHIMLDGVPRLIDFAIDLKRAR